MRTIKLVVIGNSGVGKTSLRGQYVSGRFSSGYRATIGADFIAKTVPHHSDPNESVTLQIWDTAGQERFSSLSSAFFRGADAVLLMFDVNRPDTLHALERWWTEFCERAPVAEEDMEDYCCVVVGNKIDTAPESGPAVSESDALHFIDELVPPSSPASSPVQPFSHPATHNPSSSSLPECESAEPDSAPIPLPDIAIPPPTESINMERHHKRRSKSRSSQFVFTNGTVTTMHTALESFYTPASSYFEVYESARSSPMLGLRSASPSPQSHRSHHSPRRTLSVSTFSTSSALTITPSFFTRNTARRTPPEEENEEDEPPPPPPPPPDRRPKLFFTSAKTGAGVEDVFAYVARRVVMRWEWEEATEARTLHAMDVNESTIRLDGHGRGRTRTRWGGTCCA